MLLFIIKMILPLLLLSTIKAKMDKEINKSNPPIWGAIKKIPLGMSQLFPLEKKPYVQQVCWRLKEMSVGEYTTSTTIDKKFVVVKRLK